MGTKGHIRLRDKNGTPSHSVEISFSGKEEFKKHINSFVDDEPHFFMLQHGSQLVFEHTHSQHAAAAGSDLFNSQPVLARIATYKLTLHEVSVLQWGFTLRHISKIAAKLNISVDGVQYRLGCIYEKLWGAKKNCVSGKKMFKAIDFIVSGSYEGMENELS